MTDRMKWDDLRVFLAVSRAGLLMAAGRALGMDAATVGRRITALEAARGERLFDRSPRGYALPEAGRRLTAPAQAMEAAAASLTNPDTKPGALTGTLRIGAPEGVATYILSRALMELAVAHPGLNLELAALPRVFSLSHREADLAVTVSPPTGGRLKVQHVADYRLHLYATPEIAARIRTPDGLKRERVMGYVSDMIFDKELDYLPLLNLDLTPQLTSTSIAVQQRWVEAGAGVCVLHDFAAREAQGIVQVLPEEIAFTRSFYLVQHEDDAGLPRISRTADALLDALRRALA